MNYKKLGVDWWDLDFKRDCLGEPHDDIVLTDEQVKELKNTFRIRKTDFQLTYNAINKQLLDCYHNVFPTVMDTKTVKKGKRYRVKIIDQKKLKTLRGMLKHKTDYYEAMGNDPAFDSFVDAGIRNT
mmetsp:Transcript_6207/g.23424  ORF Transcript_6207/g.23424 Transcript_6207/m.23424 type:complete len:127 (-) Transcript_6207:19-399(-)